MSRSGSCSRRRSAGVPGWRTTRGATGTRPTARPTVSTSRISGIRTPPCSVCATLSKPRLFDDLDPGWVQLVKYHNGAVALVEYAGAVAELRMARFGRDRAWRTMATLGALDEIRHTQIPLLIGHDLLAHDGNFDWTHKAFHTNQWVILAARHLFDDTTPAGRPPGRKTYTRLAAGRRIPTEYELLSTDLHYNHPRRFELTADNPVVAWYYRYREGSALQARGWERFSDPRRTTYRGYTQLQDGREDVIDGLLREIDDTAYDRDLDQKWVRFLDRWYAPLRYPVHGLQMLAAYVAQMAPASRVTNCAAFQSADELRRVQRIAYRTVQLGGPPPGIETTRRHQAAWEDAAAFQPLRELIERALIAYDWGEAFAVTNLVIKPRIDRLVKPGDRRRARDSQRRPDPGEHPLLARRGRTLASRVDRGAAAAPHRRHSRERRGGLRMDREVEPARRPGTGSLRRDPRRGTRAARCESGSRSHHQRRVAGHRLDAGLTGRSMTSLLGIAGYALQRRSRQGPPIRASSSARSAPTCTDSSSAPATTPSKTGTQVQPPAET